MNYLLVGYDMYCLFILILYFILFDYLLKLITTISIFVARIPGLSCLWYPLASFLIFHATLQYQKL